MISHHLSDTTIAAYAAGSLSEALALVAATHFGLCRACRASLQTLEATGGALLQELLPVPLADDAFERLLARVDEPAALPPPLLNPDLPAPLNRVPLGRWWPIGVGIRYRPLATSGSGWSGLIHAQPGRSFPRHGHSGLELTCILSGAYADGHGTYAAGDLAEPVIDHDQPPVVVNTEPCLCVIASEGMMLRGVLGWMQRQIWK